MPSSSATVPSEAAMPKLSVIVPVYKVEDYLPTCIDSILRQTMGDLELILIDDGSPDRCGEICDAYAASDTRVRVLHQENRGVSAARNAGLALAGGDIIGFVDPDDWIAPETYARLCAAALAAEADIAVCGFVFCTQDGQPLQTRAVPAGHHSREALLCSIYGMPNPLRGSMCNKVFSRRVLEGLRFDESVSIGEDLLLLYECYCRANGAVALSDCLYSVRNREGSATRRANAALYVQMLETYLRLWRKAGGHSKDIQRRAAEKILDICLANKQALQALPDSRRAIAYANRLLRACSRKSLLAGNLPLKRAVYYFYEGLRA